MSPLPATRIDSRGAVSVAGGVFISPSLQVAFAVVPAADALLSFAAASFVLLIIPGPAVLYIVNRSMSDGRSVALASVAGLEIGNLAHGIAATAGLSAVIAASATAFGVIKWAGAIYLVGVGLGALLRRPAEECSSLEASGVSSRCHRECAESKNRAVLSFVPSAFHRSEPWACLAASADVGNSLCLDCLRDRFGLGDRDKRVT
ncbi:MAG: LysE family translocator [Actinobacteria bacterium]|nr:LysE family translocator [Actinomycetota bacterium]